MRLLKNIVTKSKAKFQVGDHCTAAIDLVTSGRTIKKGTECVITDRHLFSDCYDIVEANNDVAWMLFVDGNELDKLSEVNA